MMYFNKISFKILLSWMCLFTIGGAYLSAQDCNQLVYQKVSLDELGFDSTILQSNGSQTVNDIGTILGIPEYEGVNLTMTPSGPAGQTILDNGRVSNPLISGQTTSTEFTFSEPVPGALISVEPGMLEGEQVHFNSSPTGTLSDDSGGNGLVTTANSVLNKWDWNGQGGGSAYSKHYIVGDEIEYSVENATRIKYNNTLDSRSPTQSISSFVLKLGVPNEVTGEITNTQNATCNGDTNGSATINATKGTAPYTYTWDNGETTATATELNAGDHTVTVTDANGCTTTQSVSISQPEALSATTTVDQNVTCNGDANGSATINATKGTAPYTYTWDNGETTATATRLNAGDHTATVTDANGCTTTQSISISQPEALSATSSMEQNVTCNGDTNGSATINATGGTAPYTYTWDNGETTATATELNTGDHTVTVTDANGCTTTQSVSISQPEALSATATVDQNVTCNGDTNGSATINATGGTPSYTYAWDNGETTATATELNAGDHTVTVTDANGCTTTQSVSISQPEALSATATVDQNVTCNGDTNGSATINATGGTPSYTYAWDNGETTATATELNAGDHTVTVTDANGCTTTQSVSISQPEALSATATVDQNVTCNGDTNGSATINATGGTPSYTYAWDNGETTATATKLNTGDHTVTVTDANGCTTTQSVSISQPEALSATATVDQNVTCNGDTNGSATINATGGTPSYTYAWDNGETTATATKLNTGDHTVTVTDANGCTTTQSVSISQPEALSATATVDQNVTCNGDTNGSATINATGGTPSYTYAWDNGETTATATKLNTGDHTVTVTDANGCTTTQSVSISQPEALSATATVDQNVTCNGDANGSATINATGGTPSYTYAWDNGETTATATGLSAGDHTVTVTDANGCTTTQSVSISQPEAINLTGTFTNATCSENGSAKLDTITGGVEPYQILWDDGSTSMEVENLEPGAHSVTITDANSCILTANFTVNPPTNINQESNDTPVNIDRAFTSFFPSTSTSTISISENVNIEDVKVYVNLTYSDLDDLTLQLTSPQGTIIDLVTQKCNNNQNIDATFTDDGNGLTCNGTPGIVGSVIPETALSSLTNESTTGDWTLSVINNSNSPFSTGTINNWSLDICGRSSTNSANRRVQQQQNKLIELTPTLQKHTTKNKRKASSTSNKSSVEKESLAMNLYPNPSNGIFKIKLNNTLNQKEDVYIEVYNFNGKKLHSAQLKSNQINDTELNLSFLGSGLYIMKLQQGTQIISKRVVIK